MTTLIDTTQADLGDFRMGIQDAKIHYIDQVVNAHMGGQLDALTPLVNTYNDNDVLLGEAIFNEMPGEKEYAAEVIENLLIEHFDETVDKMNQTQKNSESMMFTASVDYNPEKQTFAPFAVGPLEEPNSYDPVEPLQTLGIGPYSASKQNSMSPS